MAVRQRLNLPSVDEAKAEPVVHSCGLKPIPGYPRYLASVEGEVISLHRLTPKVLRPGVDGKGYLCIQLCNDDGCQSIRLHRAVALAHHPNPDDLPCVRHLDGVPSNCRPSNLRWGTYKDNEADKHQHGTYYDGRGGKLSAEDRQLARELRASGISQKTIAKQLGVTRPTITRLLNGTTWSKQS